MALAARSQTMTAAEFLAMPPDALPNAQLIDGELIVSDPALHHQRIVLRLIHSFMLFADGDPSRGEIGFNQHTPIDDRNVFSPDVWWVPAGADLDAGTNWFAVPPQLVVEVRSPGTWRYDRGQKLHGYEAIGVDEVWLVDTVADEVVVHRRSDDGIFVAERWAPPTVLTTPLVEGWEIDLAALLAR